MTTTLFNLQSDISKESKDQPAFAVNCLNSGLTKRELIAAMAMQGFIAGMERKPKPAEELANMPLITASWAVACADALLEKLNKQ